MAKQDSVVRLAILLALVAVVRLDAQVIETPVPFDSAGSVRSVTPALATRLGLSGPEWPVSGDYLQVRAFRVSSGGVVLVVERRDGAVERHVLTDAQFAAIRARVAASEAAIGARVGEERPDVISEPARGAFLRNQMILSAVVYGPLVASLANDGKTATSLYLITVGGSYFFLNSISKSTTVTRAQNALATDGAIRGAIASLIAMAAIGPDSIHDKTSSAFALGGAVGGSAIGYFRGKGLTDSEAQASMKASTFSAWTAAGVLAASGLFDDSTSRAQERLVAGTVLASGIAGYLLGPAYPRRASYTVTAGDVRLLPIGGLLGAAAGLTPFVESEDGGQGAAAAGTAGMLLGLYLVDRNWVRPFDNGSGEVTQTWLGTVAGGLLGGAVAVLLEPNAVGAMALVTGGGIAGAIAGHNFSDAPRATGAARRTSSIAAPRTRSAIGVRLNPAAVLTSAARVPGNHALVSLTW